MNIFFNYNPSQLPVFSYSDTFEASGKETVQLRKDVHKVQLCQSYRNGMCYCFYSLLVRATTSGRARVPRKCLPRSPLQRYWHTFSPSQKQAKRA